MCVCVSVRDRRGECVCICVRVFLCVTWRDVRMCNIPDTPLPSKTRTHIHVPVPRVFLQRNTHTLGIVPRAYRTHGIFGSGINFLQNSRRSVEYGDEFLTQLTEVSGRVWKLYRTHKSIGYGQ